jgi:hypothetical protein
MANDVIIEGNATVIAPFVPGAALPAHLQQAADELGSNMPERNNIPSLSYEGKVWQIVNGKDKTKLQQRNNEGDIVPMSVMRLVVIDLNGRRGRSYYAVGYDATKPAQPDCWSSDGEAPEDAVPTKQSPSCKTCPMAVKGSRLVDGREMTACSQHRILAVVPSGDIASDPLRLKIAMTSDWDKDNVDPGWFAFQQYMDFLKGQGIPHSSMVVTKAKFDNNTAYPKVLFAVDRFLSEAEMDDVRIQHKNPKVAAILSDKFTPATTTGTVPEAAADTSGKPQDPAHIAHEGSESEVWWNGEDWVAPWVAVKAPAKTPPPPPTKVVDKAAEDAANAAAVAKAEADLAEKAKADKAAKAAAAKSEKTAAAKAAADAAAAAELTVAIKPKPTEDGWIAHAGTDDELWYDGADWVAPWKTIADAVAEKPKAPPPPKPAPKADAPVTRPAPTDEAHFHQRGTDGELWWDGDDAMDWVKPWATTAVDQPESPINPAVAGTDPALTADVTALMSKWE